MFLASKQISVAFPPVDPPNVEGLNLYAVSVVIHDALRLYRRCVERAPNDFAYIDL
jgi:hypothetical protein